MSSVVTQTIRHPSQEKKWPESRFCSPEPSRPNNSTRQAGLNIQSREIRGVDDLREAVRGANLSIVQLTPGKLHGHLLHAQVGNLVLSTGDFGSAIRARGVMSPEMVTIGMMLESGGEVAQWDYDVVPGDIVVFPKSVEQEGRFTGYSSYATITLSEEDLAEHMTGEGELQDPRFWTKIDRFRTLPSRRNSSRRAIAERIAQLRCGAAPQSAAGMEFFRRALIEAFCSGIVDETSQESGEAHYNSAKLIRKVEDYADGLSSDRPLHISELCSTLNVSRRSLHRAFHDAMGIGPVAYLRFRRLSAVHHALMTLDPKDVNITQIAIDHGFADLGRFSGYFRQMFQESPSQFRRRAAVS
ncbi:AraC family transcriptional regulator [Mesorhizobium sp. ZC-5]|uniref:AraC family transcriptional regulator n=1 Tax=Mesorhizobium sp. ZC-5 TaxID=2986066 RepID=UPI0021E70159|nr:AraC family transcriptional regulator [Mesorhizobium sp. ZC-5]MCV3243726.1 helix-turn-helix domain-containing protein [Mesorhizobium sp. ZC-5]